MTGYIVFKLIGTALALSSMQVGGSETPGDNGLESLKNFNEVKSAEDYRAAETIIDALTEDEPTQLSSLYFSSSGNWRVFYNKHDCALIFGQNFDSHHLSFRYDARIKRTTIYLDDSSFDSIESGKAYRINIKIVNQNSTEKFVNNFIGKRIYAGAQISFYADDENIIDIYARAKEVEFRTFDGVRIRSYDLSSSRSGFDALRQCAKLQSEKYPTDSFTPSSGFRQF